MRNIVVLLLILTGMTHASLAQTSDSVALLAHDNTLYRMTVTHDTVTSDAVTTLPDVAAFATHFPTSDEEIEFDSQCSILSAYLHAMNASGDLYIAFDRELVALPNGAENVTRLASDDRILSLAAGGDKVVVVTCDGKGTRLQRVTGDGLAPIPTAVPDGGTIRKVALSIDGSTIAVATDDNRVLLGDFSAELEFTHTVPGSDARFMAEQLLVKDEAGRSWQVISSADWSPAGGDVLSSDVSVSPDGTHLFAWKSFVVKTSDTLRWMRPMPANQYVVEAAFSRNNTRLFVLSNELPEYAKASGPVLYLRCFDLEREDEDGRLVWKGTSKAGLGSGAWARSSDSQNFFLARRGPGG